MGEGEEREELVRKVKNMQLEDRVLFLGFRVDCLEIMAISNVFVLLSKNEPFGLSALEAVLLKIPVFVMQDSGGLKEFIINEDNGFVCRDIDDLVRKLNVTLNSKLSPLTFRSHDIHLTKFDMNGYVKVIKNTYYQFLGWEQ
jgi:glycosyltransferase involved in cell wall biosynthesis